MRSACRRCSTLRTAWAACSSRAPGSCCCSASGSWIVCWAAPWWAWWRTRRRAHSSRRASSPHRAVRSPPVSSSCCALRSTRSSRAAATWTRHECAICSVRWPPYRPVRWRSVPPAVAADRAAPRVAHRRSCSSRCSDWSRPPRPTWSAHTRPGPWRCPISPRDALIRTRSFVRRPSPRSPSSSVRHSSLVLVAVAVAVVVVVVVRLVARVLLVAVSPTAARTAQQSPRRTALRCPPA
mmetsp:Transcript_7855/g.24261  ORF Transcript_7855/g.24261 Transcript_7855/m.24261 type:complete len:238 (-) Transcript_7855:1697-2410(-)